MFLVFLFHIEEGGKRGMKKLMIITLAAVMTLAFAACSRGGGSSSGNADLSDSRYVGTWRAGELTLGGEADELKGGEWTITLNGDGTGELYSRDGETGEEETSELTWTLTDDGFKTAGGTKLTFTDDGEGIKTKILGVEIHFVRDDGSSDGSSEGTSAADYTVLGYDGDDPAVAAVYEYLANELSKEYGDGDADVSIPIVNVIAEEDSDNGETLVYGNFWVMNYKISGDTLENVSGGSHPGCMHVTKNDDGTYAVTSFDQVGDGSEFETTAKEIFGDKYDQFMAAESDQEAREALRKHIIETYVKANGLEVTKYQDYGWDPVELSLQGAAASSSAQ